MTRPLLALLLLSLPAEAQVSLRGTVTDPSGASIPGALVQLRGAGAERHTKTGDTGQFAVPSLPPGKYHVRITARGFAAAQRKNLVLVRPMVLNAQLAIQSESQIVIVEDVLGRIGTAPESNGSALTLGEPQIAALSDDPDELALQLQALAGPAPGPNGGQMFIDGFNAVNLPPKSAIREVRVNANPFSAEYDQPGFARIEIFTRPGSDSLHGQAFAQYNGEFLNSRNPLLAQSARPPYRAQLYGLDLGGPLKKNRASFTLGLEHRQIDENALILATVLNAGLTPVTLNQALAAPMSRTTVSPRLDYAIRPKNTLAIRYQHLRIGLDNQGAGDFNLPSRAYRERQSEHLFQITETAVAGPRAINETRFQFRRSALADTANAAAPGLNVQGAFFGGGPTNGNSANRNRNWELANTSTFIAGRHTLKWGSRLRQSLLVDTSVANFSGTFTFFTLARYQQTLALLRQGYSGGQIVQLGAGPSQFSLSAGTPEARVTQFDAGAFANDDWRLRPNLTLGIGLRYEAQTNLGGLSDWAPRLGLAWGIDARRGRPAKTVLRAGFGTFFDRLPLTLTLNRRRYDGVAQQSYLLLDPPFFPDVPPAAALASGRQPQQLRPVAAAIASPRLYQASVSLERQLTPTSRLAVTWIHSRGVHLLNVRNINAPIQRAYPFGDRSLRLLSESAGLSRQNQVVVNANVNARRLLLFGFYALSSGMDNNESLPADPYNLRAEWGPSTYADVRHKLVLGATAPLPWRFSLSPFLVANSGQPYNITTGLDPAASGFPAARPALLPLAATACTGEMLVFAAGFGCFDLAPAGPSIPRNYGRGPAALNLALRLARTWAFGPDGAPAPSSVTGAPHAGGMRGEGPPPGMFDPLRTRRYNLTLSASTMNALNRANFAPPNGDLSSPYFGQYRGLGGLIVMMHGGGAGTYNRKIDLQLRFSW